MTEHDAWARLLERWDRQQAVYITHREAMYATILKALASLCRSNSPVVLDFARGPGAIGHGVIQAFPGARVVAVDIDPVLLQLGQTVYDDHDGRLQRVRTDLRGQRAACLGVGPARAVSRGRAQPQRPGRRQDVGGAGIETEARRFVGRHVPGELRRSHQIVVRPDPPYPRRGTHAGRENARVVALAAR